MTTQAAEIAAVADDATGLIQVELAGGVIAEEAGHVTGGFELGVLGVALLAAEGIIDIGVADDAIGHTGHGGGGDLIGLVQAAMAGLAGVLGIQVAADIADRPEVSLLIDGIGNHWRDVAHLEMQHVRERGEAGDGRSGDLDIRVAGTANGFDGQQVVGHLGAAGSRGVTGDTLQVEAEVEFVRKGRGRGSGCRAPGEQNEGERPHPL